MSLVWKWWHSQISAILKRLLQKQFKKGTLKYETMYYTEWLAIVNVNYKGEWISNASKFITHQQMPAMMQYTLGHHWHNLLLLGFIYCIILFLNMMLCKPPLLPFSSKEVPNLVVLLDQTILIHWNFCIASTQSATLQHSKLRNND
jgi:hypothetical protein